MGCFRDVFFFSFLGLIVSVLGFGLRVLLALSDFAPVASTTEGMLATVSVSTVIFCDALSGLALTCFEDRALDCLCTIGGGTDVVLRSGLPVPASLPLSFSAAGKVGLAFKVWFSCIALSDLLLFPNFSSTRCINAASVEGLGEFGRLTSWTVSKAPRAGVRRPDCSCESSVSLPDVVCCESDAGCGEGTGRGTLIDGTSCSLRRAAGAVGLLSGGGDFSRGETGHRGLSLVSAAMGF